MSVNEWGRPVHDTNYVEPGDDRRLRFIDFFSPEYRSTVNAQRTAIVRSGNKIRIIEIRTRDDEEAGVTSACKTPAKSRLCAVIRAQRWRLALRPRASIGQLHVLRRLQGQVMTINI